jgi:hypothetical protein
MRYIGSNAMYHTPSYLTLLYRTIYSIRLQTHIMRFLSICAALAVLSSMQGCKDKQAETKDDNKGTGSSGGQAGSGGSVGGAGNQVPAGKVEKPITRIVPPNGNPAAGVPPPADDKPAAGVPPLTDGKSPAGDGKPPAGDGKPPAGDGKPPAGDGKPPAGDGQPAN